MTKLTQGALFRKFRDQIMGVTPAQDPGPGKRQPGTNGRTTGVCWEKAPTTRRQLDHTTYARRRAQTTKTRHSESKTGEPPETPTSLEQSVKALREPLHSTARRNNDVRTEFERIVNINSLILLCIVLLQCPNINV